MRTARVLALPLLALILSCDRCNVEPIAQIPQPSDQVDVFNQKTAARVDVLWMIDNSGSMAAEQEKIAQRFNQFFNQLIISQVDYHIGVVTSDPAEGGKLRAYNGPAVTGCDGCRFITKDVACPNPAVDISAATTEAAIDSILAADCPAQLVFRKLIKVGINGSSFEEGFVQAASALGADALDPATNLPTGVVPPENADFARSDASLYVVFVSDEDEGAKNDGTPIRYYQRLFEGIKGGGNENKVAVAAITGYPLENAPAPLSDVCGILATTFDNNPGNDDPRAADVKEALRNFQRGCIDLEGDPTDDNARAETGGRYIELACRTGGVVANMCEADYSSALDALGANAAGLLRKFTLSAPGRIASGSDCSLFGTDVDPNLDCDEDGRTDGTLDGPICVTARGLGSAEGSEALVARDDINGWRWDQGTSSIRFDGRFLPAPGSTVTIRYALRAANDSTCGG